MEHHHHQQQQQFHGGQPQLMSENEEMNNNGSGGGSSKSSFLCRQSSTRWIPTTDQIRILKDLYYNSGLRSPNADQIQRISARLRQYGKIEGKNVFYWFQNHKARERQKKRLTVDIAAAATTNKFSNNTNMSSSSPSGISPASHAVYAGLGQMGSNGGGSVVMERTSYMECSLPGGMPMPVPEPNVGVGVGWVSVETGATTMQQFYYHQQRPTTPLPAPHHHHHYYDDGYYSNNNKLQAHHLHIREENQHPEDDDDEEEEEEEDEEIETLPLFPIHSQETQSYFLDQQHAIHNQESNNMETSLELTLNSYYAASSSSTPHGSEHD